MISSRPLLPMLALAALGTTSDSSNAITPRQSSSTCPSIWTTIATDLKSSFVSSSGGCTDDARAAIRLSFHDCFPSACDGSIILADECTTRGENTQLVDICTIIGDKATQYNVSTADMIQFGTAIGIASCTNGPVISFLVGRTDSSTANPTGQMPSAADSAATLIAAFAAKGFTSTELVALVGAHSTGKNLSGTAFDSTVGTWDTTFYSETAAGTAPTSLDSDVNLSNSSDTASAWSDYAASFSDWTAAFVPAMEKMALLGNDASTMIDCSSVITDAFPYASSSTSTSTSTSAKSNTNNSTTADTETETTTASSDATSFVSNLAYVAYLLLAAWMFAYM